MKREKSCELEVVGSRVSSEKSRVHSMKCFFVPVVASLLCVSLFADAEERYKQYLGFTISGAYINDDLQSIDVSSDDVVEAPVSTRVEEGGIMLVWDLFNENNQAAFSLMFLSVYEDSTEEYADRSIYEGRVSTGGLLLAGKYFPIGGFYLGGGATLLTLVGDVLVRDHPILPDGNLDFESDSSTFAPTVMIGYRGLVSSGKNSDFYVGVDWVKTLPVDVDYEASGFGIIIRDTYKEFTISMLGASFGWMW